MVLDHVRAPSPLFIYSLQRAGDEQWFWITFEPRLHYLYTAFRERETGLEPATSCLEGKYSTN